MPTASLERIFNPRSIAIIGVSSTPGKAGRLVLENLLTQGFDGRIFPVNPNLREIIGRRCYSSAAELPQ